MKIEFLGTGGAITTPKPGCGCRICVEAREKGVPYSRTGPSVFIHGQNILFDTPEESNHQLNRSKISNVRACFYSHWHPDHTMGRRVFETLNHDFVNWPPQNKCTDIYLPKRVSEDFDNWLGLRQHFDFLEKIGVVKVARLSDEDGVTIDNLSIYPFRLAQDFVYAFLAKENEKSVLIIMDEQYMWEPPDFAKGVDLLIIPMGIVEFDPLTGERKMPEGHPVLREEATFEQTLDMIRKIKPQKTIISHIEGSDEMGYDELKTLEEKLKQEGLNITFAFDTMKLEV